MSVGRRLIRVYSTDGQVVGEGKLTLAAGRRISRLLFEPEYVPASAGKLGGFIVITSTKPVIAQQLFANSRPDMLSAVPPTIVK